MWFSVFSGISGYQIRSSKETIVYSADCSFHSYNPDSQKCHIKMTILTVQIVPPEKYLNKFWIFEGSGSLIIVSISVCYIICLNKSWKKHFFFRIIESHQVFSYFLRKLRNYLILTSRDKNLTTLQYQFYKQCNA